MRSEADFYKVEIGESVKPHTCIQNQKFAFMPTGCICVPHPQDGKYGVFMLNDNKWFVYGYRDTFEDCIKLYNKVLSGVSVLSNSEYICISEIIDDTPDNLANRPKTLKEYLEYEPEKKKECSWSLMRCFGDKFHGTKTEITKSLADYLVKHSKKKKYFKDCVALSGLSFKYDTHGWSVITREFGKYYCIGYWDLPQCEEYRGPSYVEKDAEYKGLSYKNLHKMLVEDSGFLRKVPVMYGESIANIVNNSGETIQKGDVDDTVSLNPKYKVVTNEEYSILDNANKQLDEINSFLYHKVPAVWQTGATLLEKIKAMKEAMRFSPLATVDSKNCEISKSSLKEMQDKIAANNAEVKRLNATINDLTNKNRALHELANRRDKVEMAKKIDELTKNNRALYDEKNCLQTNCDELKHQKDDLLEKVKQLESKCNRSELFQRNNYFSNLNDKLKDTNTSLDKENQSLHNQNNELRDKLAKSQKSLYVKHQALEKISKKIQEIGNLPIE